MPTSPFEISQQLIDIIGSLHISEQASALEGVSLAIGHKIHFPNRETMPIWATNNNDDISPPWPIPLGVYKQMKSSSREELENIHVLLYGREFEYEDLIPF